MKHGASGQRSSGQYLVGLCLAWLGVCAAGWLMVTALAFTGPAPGRGGGRGNGAAVATLATAAGLALVAMVTFACWARAWRRVLRADGVLAAPPVRSPAGRNPVRRQTRGMTPLQPEPEPARPANAARMLAELRDQLGPLVAPAEPEPEPQASPSPGTRADLIAVSADGSTPPDAEEDR